MNLKQLSRRLLEDSSLTIEEAMEIQKNTNAQTNKDLYASEEISKRVKAKRRSNDTNRYFACFEPEIKPSSTVPLFSWEKLKLTDHSDEISHQNESEVIAVYGKIDNSCFATVFTDTYMDPIIPIGSTLVFSMRKLPQDRDYVLIKTRSYVYLRQLIIEGNSKYIKTLSSGTEKIMIELNDTDKILAVLVQWSS